MSTTSPQDIIKLSLSDIGAYAPGEQIEPALANDAFDTLNDMLDQWSNQKQLVYCVQEVIHEVVGGKYVYSIGAPGTDVTCAFTGSIAGTTLTVTLISAGALSVGQIISGTGIPAGTAVTALGTALGGNGLNGIGTYQINRTLTIGSEAMTSYAPRPMRINNAFVRVVNSATGTLDFPVGIMTELDYARIGIKSLPGPWPKAVYYQPSMPTGILNYWPAPAACEMHLFADTILSQFQSLADVITLPPGYKMAMRWCLAELLMPSYGKSDQMQAQMVMKNATKGLAFIKRMNAQPYQPVQFDPVLLGNRIDAGWILHGGFNY